MLAWASTVLLAAGQATADPLAGLGFVAVPTMFATLVRHRGLGGIPTVVFVAVIAVSLVPAGFLLGEYRADAGRSATGLVIILVWVLAYPGMVRYLDRQYLREHFSFPDGSVPREPLAEFRVRVLALWLTVAIMLLVGEALVAAVMAFALLHRRWWTALAAVPTCLVIPLVSVGFDAVSLEARPLVVLAALVAAHQWLTAIGDSLPADAGQVSGVAARSRSVAGGGAGPAY